MTTSLTQASLFTLKPAAEHVVAIYYHGSWKVQRMAVSRKEAEATARDVHRRTGMVVQVRGSDDTVLAQYGYPVLESDFADTCEEEE
jgi:hypothetical protein